MPMDWQVKAPISAMKNLSFKKGCFEIGKKSQFGKYKNSHTITIISLGICVRFFVGYQTSFSCL